MHSVTESAEPLEALARRTGLRMGYSSRRNDEILRRIYFFRCNRFGDAAVLHVQCDDRASRHDLDCRVREIFSQYARHVDCLLRFGEGAFSRLDLERESACGEKIEGTLHAEFRERGIQEVFGGTVVLGEGMFVEFGIGDIASAAAGNIELPAEGRIFLEQEDGLAALSGTARRHHSRRSASDDDDVVCFPRPHSLMYSTGGSPTECGRPCAIP